MRRGIIQVGSFCALLLWSAASYAAVTEVDLGADEKSIQQLERRLSELRGRYINPMGSSKGDTFDVRYERARFLYDSKDYTYASIILGDLMRTKEVEKRAVYPQMLWYLGDSFAHTGNTQSAREYLNRVIAIGPSGEHFREAMVRQIEMAVDAGRFEEAEKAYAGLSREGGGTAGFDLIQYAYAKSLHKKGDLARALKMFAEVPTESVKYGFAQYFEGVVLVELNRLDEALAAFARVGELTPTDDPTHSLYELALLAQARVLFEQKKFMEAQSLYRRIPLDSRFFDQASYELSWIYIQRERFEEAANTLDLLLLAMPESIYAPQSQVLKGNIQLMQNKFQDADYSFQLVINKYTHVVEALDRLINETAGKKAEEIRAHLLGDQTSLPPVALKWLAEDEDVRRAMALSGDITTSETDTTRSRRVIDALRVHLDQQSHANLFPELKEGNERAIELEHAITLLAASLTQASTELLGGHVPDADRDRLAALQAKRRELTSVYGQLPKTVQERYDRRRRQLDKIEEMDKKVFQLTMQLKSVEELLDTIQKRYEQLRGDPRTSQEFLAQAKKDVTEVMSVATELTGEVTRVQGEVALWIERTKVGDEAQNNDEAVRRELNRVLDEEVALAAHLRSSLPSEQVALFDRLEAAKKRTDSLQAGLISFRTDLDGLVAGQVEGFQRDVAVIETEIMAYEKELAAFKFKAGGLADQIASHNLTDVRTRFHDVVLKANVGQVDSAWERRQLVRKKIDELLEQRSEEKQNLNQTFQESRGD